MLGIGAIIPSLRSHTAKIESVDPEDCILVVDVHNTLSERERANIHDGLCQWKKEYSQLENLPVLVVDTEMDIKIIRRKGTSKI